LSTQKGKIKFVRKTKAERQREIVDVTVKLLGKYGVEGTTVSRIAAAAGIARGALYQHFPNRRHGRALVALDP
jgi:AcrR family transcriptional regulator